MQQSGIGREMKVITNFFGDEDDDDEVDEEETFALSLSKKPILSVGGGFRGMRFVRSCVRFKWQ